MLNKFLFIDYDYINSIILDEINEQESQEIYLFIDINKHSSLSSLFLEKLLPIKEKIHWININKDISNHFLSHLLFFLGKISALYSDIQIIILADEKDWQILQPLLPHAYSWKTNNPLKEPVKKTIDDTQVISNIEPEPIIAETSKIDENQKIHSKKRVLIENEAEHLRFINNTIFNQFSSDIYLNKIIPPASLQELKELLMTNYFSLVEDYLVTEKTEEILIRIIERLQKKDFISIKNEQVFYTLSQEMIYKNFIDLIRSNMPKKSDGLLNLANYQLFFLSPKNKEIYSDKLIKRGEEDGYFSHKNKRVIYHLLLNIPTDNPPAKLEEMEKNLFYSDSQLSACYPKTSIVDYQIDYKSEEDKNYLSALQMIQTPNRPKTKENLKRFLRAKLKLTEESLNALIERLFQERYLLELEEDRITYRLEFIRGTKYQKIITALQKSFPNNPKEIQTLLRYIQELLGGKTSYEECQSIIRQLIDDKYIQITNDSLSYDLHFPA